MANTQKYLNHLLQNTGITPACSEEERAAADVIADIFSNHGFEPEIQEVRASGTAKVVYAGLGLAVFLGAVLMGVGGAVSVIGFLAALAAAVIFWLERSGRQVLSQLGSGGLSQNVIAHHKASGPLASPRNRPVVVVAHYDSPRADFLCQQPYSSYRPLMVKFLPYLMCVPAAVAVIRLLPLSGAFKVILWILAILASLVPLATAVAIIANRFFLPYTSGAICNKSSVAAMLGVMDAVSPYLGGEEFPGDEPFESFVGEQRRLAEEEACAWEASLALESLLEPARDAYGNPISESAGATEGSEEGAPADSASPGETFASTPVDAAVPAPPVGDGSPSVDSAIENPDASEPDAATAATKGRGAGPTSQDDLGSTVPMTAVDAAVPVAVSTPTAPEAAPADGAHGDERTAPEPAQVEDSADAVPSEAKPEPKAVVNSEGNIRFGAAEVAALGMLPASCALVYEDGGDGQDIPEKTAFDVDASPEGELYDGVAVSPAELWNDAVVSGEAVEPVTVHAAPGDIPTEGADEIPAAVDVAPAAGDFTGEPAEDVDRERDATREQPSDEGAPAPTVPESDDAASVPAEPAVDADASDDGRDQVDEGSVAEDPVHDDVQRESSVSSTVEFHPLAGGASPARADDNTLESTQLFTAVPATPDRKIGVPSTSDAPAPHAPASANRASLFDLPDPSDSAIDPFAPSGAPGSSANSAAALRRRKDIAKLPTTEAPSPAEEGSTPAKSSDSQAAHEASESEGNEGKGLLGGISRFFKRKKKHGSSMSDWLGVDDNYDARQSGGEIGSWDKFEDDSSWKGGAVGSGGATDHELMGAVTSMGDDELLGHDIWFVATGASENGNAGIEAFLAEHRKDLRGVFLINLESVGAGQLAMVATEGGNRVLKGDRRIMKLVSRVSSDFHHEFAAVDMPYVTTDAHAAMNMSLRSLTIAGIEGTGFALSHTVDDDPLNVDEDNVDFVADVVTEVIRRS